MKVKKAVAVTQYMSFDPCNPHKTNAKEFALLEMDEHGGLGAYWIENGYVMVGTADVEITMHSAEVSTNNAVTALKKQKEAVLATAQAKATDIERKIQTLMAITNEDSKT